MCRTLLIAVTVLVGVYSSSEAAVIAEDAGTPQAAIDAFERAIELWDQHVTADLKSMDYRLRWRDLGSSVAGGADGNTFGYFDYTDVRAALIANAKSANDRSAVATLPENAIDLYLNRVANNPNGFASFTPFVDDNDNTNNTTVRVELSLANVLGLTHNFFPDGRVTMNSRVLWDFDQRDGITPGTLDYTGVVLHELGHIYGFRTVINQFDRQDTSFLRDDDFFAYAPTIMDLFRYSTESAALGIPDVTAGNTPRYFSADGGLTSIADLSTGQNFGDGYQASHTAHQFGALMDPVVETGAFRQITATDLAIIDVLGFNLVPEPTTAAILGLAAIGLLRRRRAA